MNVSMITMEPEEAQAKLTAYRQALLKRHSSEVHEEWSAAEVAYGELAKGTPLIDPLTAIAECGWRADGRPKIALVRADKKLVHFTFTETSRWWNSDAKTYLGDWSPMMWMFTGINKRSQRSSPRLGAGARFEVRVTTQPPVAPRDGLAMVPMVPPDVLPARGCDLSKHFVLFEVEDWNHAPPVDPILLRLIGGGLYAVIAQWNLTELERMIIKGTRGNV